MKILATLTATAILAANVAAHADQPVQLDDAALDQATAGLSFLVSGYTFLGRTSVIGGLGRQLTDARSSASVDRTLRETAGGRENRLFMSASAVSRSVAAAPDGAVVRAAAGGGVEFFVGN